MLYYPCLFLLGDKYPTVPFKSKWTIHCESQFSTQFAIPARIENRESRTSYQEWSRRSSLTGQKTKDSPITDFPIILQRPTAVTQHGMVIFTIRKSDSMLERRPIWVIKQNVSSRTSVSSFISSSKISNACSICKHTVHTRVQAKACLFCNVKQF